MRLNRRRFYHSSGHQRCERLRGIQSSGPSRGNTEDQGHRLRGFTTFDPRPVFALAEELFPGEGAELSNAWRTRQFEYAWLRTLTAVFAWQSAA